MMRSRWLPVVLVAAICTSGVHAAPVAGHEPPRAAVTVNGGPGIEGVPFKRDDSGEIGTSAAVATAVCLLLLAAWVAVQVRAKRGQSTKLNISLRLPGLPVSRPAERSLRVLESASLTSSVRLHIVNWRGKEYLISTAADTVQVMDTADGASGAQAGKVEPAVRGRGRK